MIHVGRLHLDMSFTSLSCELHHVLKKYKRSPRGRWRVIDFLGRKDDETYPWQRYTIYANAILSLDNSSLVYTLLTLLLTPETRTRVQSTDRRCRLTTRLIVTRSNDGDVSGTVGV